MSWLCVCRGILLGVVVALAFMSRAAGAEAREYERGGFRFRVGPPPEWVVERTPAAAWTWATPTTAEPTHWRNWLSDSQSNRRAGKRERYLDNVYEPITSEMTREAGKVQVWFSPEFQQLTLHRVAIRRQGQWVDRLDVDAVTLARRESQFERDMSTGVVSALLVLEDVRPGDLVRVTYTISGHNPIMAGLDEEEFVFAWSDPVLDRTARVLFDAGVVVRAHGDAGVPKTVERRSPAGVELSASAHSVAAVIAEGNYPRWYAALPRLVVSEARDWSTVGDWAARLYPAPGPLPEDLERRLLEWKALPDTSSRVAAALRAVQDDVRYFGIELGDNTHKPAEPAETWNRRYGDCKDKARLLSTLLGRLGVTANPALVSFSTGRRIGELPPSAAAFDHVIVQVSVNGRTWWLDPTLTQQRGTPEAIVPIDYGLALPVLTGTRALVTVESPADARNTILVSERFEPADDGTVGYRVETSYEGDSADVARRHLAQRGNEAVARGYVDFYQRRYGELKEFAPLVVVDDASRNRLTMTESYRLASPWLTATPAARNIETFADSMASYLQVPGKASRLAPYALIHPVAVEHVSELVMPPSWRWDGSVQTRKVENAAMSFTFDARQDGNTVRIRRTYRSLAGFVPAEAFKNYFGHMREISDLLGWRILASPPAADVERQRGERLKSLMRDVIKTNAAGSPRN